MAVAAKGDIRVCINDISHIITDVYYVPELKTNPRERIGGVDSK